MSGLLHANNAFISLLLDTADKRQQKALLQTITHKQLNALGEIFYNLLNIVPMSKEDEKLIKKSRHLSQKLSLISKSFNSRRKLVLSNKAKILKVLLHFKANLLKLLHSQPLAA